MSQQDRVEFECTLSSAKSIRNFAAAFNTLGKLGKEVSLEAAQSTRTLTLRQVNSAKTSFLAFEFRGAFFELFTVSSQATCAKLRLKSCQAVFRTLKPMERLVLSLVQTAGGKHVVMFRTTCQHSVTKTHQFYFEETDALDPVFDRETCKHRIRASAKFLHDVLQHVHGEEIDFQCLAGIQARISSLSTQPQQQPQSQQQQPREHVNTEMQIPSDKFEEFAISETRTLLTFGIREWRELLRFCDSNQRDLDQVLVYFNDAGMPLLLASEPPTTTESSMAFTLVLSTMPPRQETSGIGE